MNRFDLSHFPLGHRIKILLPDFKNAMVGAEPQPAFAVGNDLRNVIVKKTLFRADPVVAAVFEPAHSQPLIANPQRAIVGGRQATNGQRCVRFGELFSHDFVSLNAKQITSSRANPNGAFGVLGHGADGAHIAGKFGINQISIAQTLQAIDRSDLAEP